MKIDSQEIAAIAQAEHTAPRWDMYVIIHKALRAYMSDTLVALGRMDVDDDLEFAQTCQRVLELMDFCRGHLQHENEFVHPAMERRAPATSGRIAGEHVQHEADIAQIAAGAAHLLRMPRPRRQAGAVGLYRQLSYFVAHNYEHMLVEECEHNAVLWANYSDEELMAVEHALIASLAPQEMMLTLRWMLPTMAPAERVGMLAGMRQDAPPLVFQAVLDLAQAHLTPCEWSKLASALGLESAAA